MSMQTPATSEPRYEFHRLLRRDERYRWWRPLAMLGTAGGFFVVLAVVVMLFVMFTILLNPALWASDSDGWETLEQSDLIDMSDPFNFFFLMMTIIIMIPAIWLAYLLLGSKPVGLLLSVTGKMRWKWLGLASAVSLVVYAVFFALSFALDAVSSTPQVEIPAESMPTSPLFYALLVLLLTPLQCTAEELVFRGAFMQAIGAWLKHPAFAILLPMPLFTLGHDYDLYGMLDVAVFAIAAGYLSWRTGGLEAAIAMHIINNTTLFLLGSVGLVDLNDSNSNPTSLISSVVLTFLLASILLALAKKMNLQRTAGPAPRKLSPPLLQPWPLGYPQAVPPTAYWAPPAEQHSSPESAPYYQPPQSSAPETEHRLEP